MLQQNLSIISWTAFVLLFVLLVCNLIFSPTYVLSGSQKKPSNPLAFTSPDYISDWFRQGRKTMINQLAGCPPSYSIPT